MAKRERETDRVKRWTQRITAATTTFDAWHDKFRCKQLESYYEGFQWAGMGLTDEDANQRYTINFMFATVEVQIPSLLFSRPRVTVSPKPAHQDDQQSQSGDRSKLAQDTIQTFIDKKEVGFKLESTLALKDALFRFGIVEVGYTADWIDNPNAGKPMLKEDSEEPMTGEDGSPVIQPSRTPRPDSEQLFIKRIPPETFRVSVSNRNDLKKNDWVGYYEWHYVEDVKANPKYSNTSKLKSGGEMKDDAAKSESEQEQYRGMVKLWKLWDLRERKRYVLADGHEKFLLDGEPYTYLPLAGLKFFERSSSWYPIPPTFNWISPQDEMNEIREMRRVHRKRFYRRYTMRKGIVDDTELDKLESGGDGVIIKHSGAPDETPILAVPDAPLDPGNMEVNLAEARDDFMQISGVGAEQRGQAQADTATQANIIESRSQIRESRARVQVGEWLGEIATLMFLCLVEKMQLPFWVQINTDPQAQDLAQVQNVVQQWQSITAEKLEGLSLDVAVDIASLSPVSQDQERSAWLEVLTMLTANPALLMMVTSSDVLLRKLLAFYGIKSQADINEIKKACTLLIAVQAAQAQAGAGQPPGAPGSASPSGPVAQPAGIPATGATVQ